MEKCKSEKHNFKLGIVVPITGNCIRTINHSRLNSKNCVSVTFTFPLNSEGIWGNFFDENKLSKNSMKSIPIDSNFQADSQWSHLVLIKSVTFLMKNCLELVKKSKIVSQTQEWLGYFVSVSVFFHIFLYHCLALLMYYRTK